MFGKVHFNNKKLVVYTGSFNLVIKAHYLMLSGAINQIGLKKASFCYIRRKRQQQKNNGKEGKFKAFYDIFGE